jgi:hypothetical protein
MKDNSPVALEVVTAQIAGMDAEIIRIDQQVAQLLARREGVVLMRKTLAPLVDANMTPGTGSLTLDNSGPSTPLVMVASAANGAAMGPTRTGFREAVRKVLREAPKGLRAAEVLQELAKRGELARYNGKARPATRVHNELYSLLKSHKLSRRGSRYFFNETERPQA